jgi:hypothetical protein
MGQHVWHGNCVGINGGEWGAPPLRKWSGGAFLRCQLLTLQRCSMMQHLAKMMPLVRWSVLVRIILEVRAFH